MCLFSGSLRSKLPYSSVLILVWLLGRVSIFLARMLTLFQQLPTMTACGGRKRGRTTGVYKFYRAKLFFFPIVFHDFKGFYRKDVV